LLTPHILTRICLHAALWLLAFVPLLALLQRPLFALLLVAGLHLLLIAVSAAKRRVLREPLVYADLALFSQAFRHPRLYLPYFGLARAAAIAVAFAAVLVAGLWLEPAQPPAPAAWAVLFIAGLALLLSGSRVAITLDPAADVARFGLLPALWLYAIAERRFVRPVESPFAALPPGGRIGRRADPHIVAIQSESFFDARRLHAGIAPAVLERFDALRAGAESGRLAVPVWGAYTMRTEFAFLSGIAPDALGIHRFNPYRRFARRGVATIATALRERGYRTLCLHPYPASFFGRDRVFPALGFDEFIDVAGFDGATRSGPYIADAEVTERIAAALRTADRPLFVFAITMENHGPLHLEKTGAQDAARLYRSLPPAGCDELTVYLRHLANADAMLGALAAELGPREGALCFYGDHVPGMPAVYAALGYDDPRTDYLLWHPHTSAPAVQADLGVEALAARLLSRAGLASS
jgi:phosphoglycerol transferase MdoB-like AlkP superfamily enzyme